MCLLVEGRRGPRTAWWQRYVTSWAYRTMDRDCPVTAKEAEPSRADNVEVPATAVLSGTLMGQHVSK